MQHVARFATLSATLLLCACSGSSDDSATDNASLNADYHYGEIYAPATAVLPEGCAPLQLATTCESDPEFEFALEQEFWGIIGNGRYGPGDLGTIKDWNGRGRNYLSAVKDIDTYSETRLRMFVAFSYLVMFIQGEATSLSWNTRPMPPNTSIPMQKWWMSSTTR